MYPYKFVKTMLAGCLGTGAEGYALTKPNTNPLGSIVGAGRMVRGGLAPTTQGFVKYNQDFTGRDIRGSGLDVQGQFGLQALSRMSNPNG